MSHLSIQEIRNKRARVVLWILQRIHDSGHTEEVSRTRNAKLAGTWTYMVALRNRDA